MVQVVIRRVFRCVVEKRLNLSRLIWGYLDRGFVFYLTIRVNCSYRTWHCLIFHYGAGVLLRLKSNSLLAVDADCGVVKAQGTTIYPLPLYLLNSDRILRQLLRQNCLLRRSRSDTASRAVYTSCSQAQTAYPNNESHPCGSNNDERHHKHGWSDGLVLGNAWE